MQRHEKPIQLIDLSTIESIDNIAPETNYNCREEATQVDGDQHRQRNADQTVQDRRHLSDLGRRVHVGVACKFEFALKLF